MNTRSVTYGGAGDIPPADVACQMDEFENAVRSACEWFGHAPDSEFTAETIRVLRERSIMKGNE